MGQSPSSSSYSEEKNGLPFLQGCAEFGDKHPTPVKYCSTPLKVAPKGSVLVSVRAPVGDINIADQDYIIGRGLSAILATGINQDLLPYLLDFVKPQLRRVAQGSTFEAISFDDLDRCQLPDLGDEKEQAKIAEVLTAIDRAIAQTEALIAKHQRIKTGLMQDLLTRGIDKHGQLRDPSTHRFKSTPLGMIPEEWEYDLFGKHISSSAFGPRFPGTEYDDLGALATLRTTDMDNEGNIVSAKLPRANLNPVDYEKHLLHPGDILISRSGTIGVTTVFTSYEVPVIPAAFIIRFRPKDTLVPEYFRIYLNSYIGRKVIVTNAEGGVQKNLRGSTVLGLYFPFPEPDEQRRIAQIIESQNNQLVKLTTQYEKLSSIKQGLMQDLLSGRVSVKPLMEE